MDYSDNSLYSSNDKRTHHEERPSRSRRILVPKTGSSPMSSTKRENSMHALSQEWQISAIILNEYPVLRFHSETAHSALINSLGMLQFDENHLLLLVRFARSSTPRLPRNAFFLVFLHSLQLRERMCLSFLISCHRRFYCALSNHA